MLTACYLNVHVPKNIYTIDYIVKIPSQTIYNIYLFSRNSIFMLLKNGIALYIMDSFYIEQHKQNMFGFEAEISKVNSNDNALNKNTTSFSILLVYMTGNKAI